MSDDTPERITGQHAPTNTERSPRRGMCAAVLSLQAITLGLTTPVMITIADVATGTALAVGLGLAVVCLLLAGMLRAEWAYLAGYAVQVAAIALGTQEMSPLTMANAYATFASRGMYCTPVAIESVTQTTGSRVAHG